MSNTHKCSRKVTNVVIVAGATANRWLTRLSGRVLSRLSITSSWGRQRAIGKEGSLLGRSHLPNTSKLIAKNLEDKTSTLKTLQRMESPINPKILTYASMEGIEKQPIKRQKLEPSETQNLK